MLTLDEATAWIDAMGLCLFLPQRNQFVTPAPSFVEACIGAPSDTPSPTEIDNARGLMIRLTESGTALPLSLLGAHTDQPDFLASRDAFPYIFSLRGGRNWKTPPPKASPLVVEIWRLLERGASLEATEIQAVLGREITETAALRGLLELWGSLRVMPVHAQDSPTRWELTQARFYEAMNAANKIAQTTGLSALVSLYLESVIAATPEEIETFLSPLVARSKVREVVNGLAATRQIAIVPVGTHTMYYITGSLPEFAEPEEAVEVPKPEPPKPAFETRRGFREQRPSFSRERSGDRGRGAPPRRERFAARGEDRGRPTRFDSGAKERRPFRKFEGERRGGKYSPRAEEPGGKRRPFRPRLSEDAGRAGGKFPPKKFGEEREPPPKKFSGKRPFFRGNREEGRPERAGYGEKDRREDFPQRTGGWKPGQFEKSGKPRSGGAKPGSSQFKGPRWGAENQDRGKPGGAGQGGSKFTGKRFGGTQWAGKRAGGKSGFKSRPKTEGAKPPFRKGKNKKWKNNKGEGSGGKNSE